MRIFWRTCLWEHTPLGPLLGGGGAVMSMHKLTVGDGYAYLTRHVAAGDAGLSGTDSLTAYYEQTGNPAGRWLGRGLDALGANGLLDGSLVTEAAMAQVFRDGCDPISRLPLGKAYPQVSPGEGRHAVAGYDLTFTAPKSVSVVWGLADSATRGELYEAHRAALSSALRFVEHSVLRTRVGAAGCRQVKTLGMVAAAFDHWDSRAGDPNLHTHVVIANKVQGPDGIWRSVDGRTLHGATVTVSQLYDALLADEVSRRLGATWSSRDRGERRNPAFELDGVGEDLLTEFSTRSEQIRCAEQRWIREFTERRGRAPSRTETTRARQHLTRETRPPKVVRALGDLLADWANRARALTGVEPLDLAARALTAHYGRALRATDVGPEVRAAIVAQMIDDVSTRRSVWSTWNLGAAALRSSMTLRMASPADRLALTDDLVTLAGSACIRIDDPESVRQRVGEETFTSLELLEAERALRDAAETDIPLGIHPLAGRIADRHMAALADDQHAAAKAVLHSTRALDVLVGPAGSGKTTTLSALAGAWRQVRGNVIGLAPSASAAATLSGALSSRCETAAKWIYESVGDGAAQRALRYGNETDVLTDPTVGYWDRNAANQRRGALVMAQEQWRFGRGDLVIVDEASMADTRTLAVLVEQAAAADAKVLLVGDHLQRGSVDAGGAFGMLARRGPTAELRTLWRFSHPWEARATLDLRHGDPAALDAYVEHKRISHGSHDDMLEDALAAATDADAETRTVLLAAADQRTVNELNARTRAERIRTGLVRPAGVTLSDGLTGGVGDRIVTRRNNRRLRTSDGFVRNGDLWRITAVLPDGGLRVQPIKQPDGGAALRLPAQYVAEAVELGYATTTARSQGMTVDETHTVVTAGMGREDLYVALSRGRHLNRLYVATDRPDNDCLPSGDTATAREVLDRILATTRAETSATETWASHHPEAPQPPVPASRRQPAIPALRPQMAPRPSTPPTSPTTQGPVLDRW
ncbi:MobF family relaxase [Cellulomonas sp. Leaf334]|uniref:MobF family relaxase n=1 Tax=Cellulomonas sp. Leaf334 TaxID=1736339 RepID=UPI001F336E37|nr:MobF family relaxase [Cellulomonas sp. Leaf334]